MKKHALTAACGAVLVAGCADMTGPEHPTATATLEPRGGSQVRGTVTCGVIK